MLVEFTQKDKTLLLLNNGVFGFGIVLALIVAYLGKISQSELTFWLVALVVICMSLDAVIVARPFMRIVLKHRKTTKHTNQS